MSGVVEETVKLLEICEVKVKTTKGEKEFLYTPNPVARDMLMLGELKPGETLFDLGCGKGNLLFIAAEEFKARAIGIEIHPYLVRDIKDKICSPQYENKILIIEGDLFEQNISSADLITLYLYPSMMEKLRTKLDDELKPGTRVVSLIFKIDGWKPLKEKNVKYAGIDNRIYLYKK
jgi:16S rRNA A1518/A1519 N6-dimethyltransferase RsmA/KsgA/DIM1 with predicted DNA glycosylase/AP lyase activity